jgi:uncharacterized repeat protein (TIGR03803 family)
MQRQYSSRFFTPVFVIAIFLLCVTRATANTSVQILEAFQGPNGANPAANLITDKSGNLYGTTEYGGPGDYYGNVFRLSPPAQPGGSWTTTILYSFKNSGDGARPTDPLLLDTAGALFGTTSDSNAGGYGEVFKLTPPASGSGEWTETVLYSFKGTASDGAYPQGGLVADRTGNLYGTTQTSVFELSPPTSKGAAWTFTQLHAFQCCTADGDYAIAGLVRDSQGNLYGTTEMGGFYGTNYCAGSGCGTVFEVSPPTESGGSWTEQVLYSFKSNLSGYSDGFYPLGTLILDKAGNLFGNTVSGGALGGGTVFELSPPSVSGGTWTETMLHNFSYSVSDDGAAPLGNLIFDEAGNLYGTTQFGGNYCVYNQAPYGCGTVFKLIPDGGSWREVVLYFFENGPDVARFPGAGLLLYSDGGLFGTTQYGGDTACQSDPAVGCGLVFQLKP